MTLSHNQEVALHRQLVAFEGFKTKPYKDTLGNLTIGVGHLLKKGLTRRAIECILDDDIDEAAQWLSTALPWTSTLDPIRYRVLLDMTFNLGPGMGEFRATLKAVKAGQFEEASRHMLDSLWAEQVGRRAQILAAMMRTGVDPFADPVVVP